MFGIKGRFGDLVLEPKLVAEQFDENGHASAELVFAGRKLKIVYCLTDMEDSKETGVRENTEVCRQDSLRVLSVTVHGKQKGSCIPRTEIESWDINEQHEIRAVLVKCVK